MGIVQLTERVHVIPENVHTCDSPMEGLGKLQAKFS